jgi:hypothetical protein
MNRHPALVLRLSMISAQTHFAFVAREKPLHIPAFAGQAFSGSAPASHFISASASLRKAWREASRE